MSEKDELLRLLDGFEHECFMLRVEASETRAKDEDVRKAYERIREEAARAIAATLGSDTKGCENLLWELVGALDVADATNASKKPIVTEHARRIAATLGGGKVTEDGIDKWMRSYQSEHGELAHIGPDELRELAFALHNDIPLGYEASMRLGHWLLNATLGGGECRNQWQWNSGFCCSECFYSVPFVDKFANKPFAHCPNCARKVVER